MGHTRLRIARAHATKQQKRLIHAGSFALVSMGCVALVTWARWNSPSHVPSSDSLAAQGTQGRRLAELVPEDLFSKEELSNGAVSLHIFGMLYMFLGLAIVCDELFVPILEVIVEKLDISFDVAGATFMAAGSSAPELFTSIVGTFFVNEKNSDVGFGTIVGSAVFNVLVIIGAVGLGSATPTVLTSYPLVRDITFYCLTVALLFIFFALSSELKIEAWKAGLMVFLYLCYVLLMKVNPAVRRAYYTKLLKKADPAIQKKQGQDEELKEIVGEKRARTDSETVSPNLSAEREDKEGEKTYRVGIHTLLSSDKDILDHLARHVVHKIQGSVRETFDSLDRNGDGCIDIGDVEALLKAIFGDVDPEHVKIVMKELGEEEEEKKEAGGAEQGVDGDEGDKALKKISFEAFKAWYDTSEEATILKERKASMEEEKTAGSAENEEGEEEEEGFSLVWPETTRARVWYLFTLPLVLPMILSVPALTTDEQKTGLRVTVAFVMTVFWIAAFSYCMVWWATIAGETIGLSAAVMGMTVLAAGTSVPDMLGSLIVAKQGEGDAAVSNSIGSNVFDILLGLGLPWFFKAVTDKPVQVRADSLERSVAVLFGIVLVVVAAISLNGWKLTRLIGVVFFLVYIGFVVMELALAA